MQFQQPPPKTNISLNSLLANPNQGLMTSEKYDEYIKNNCEDILHFICDEMLGNLQDMLSLHLCPIRTPVHEKPHHLESAAKYKDYLDERLSLISKRLQDYQITTMSSRHHFGNASNLPPLDALQELAQQYRGHPPACTTIKYINELMKEIQNSCNQLWEKRKSMHANVTQVFEEHIRIICTQVIKTFQEITPDLTDRLKTRKQIESQLYQSYEQIKTVQYQERTQFYGEVQFYAEEQVRFIKDMLNITHILLNQYDPRKDPQVLPKVAATYTQVQERYRSLDKSINIWLKILKSRSTMDNPVPILPRILHDLQKWLEQFQKFFLFCIQEWMPRQPRPAKPLPPVQVMRNYHGELEPEFLRKGFEVPPLPSTLDESVVAGLDFQDHDEVELSGAAEDQHSNDENEIQNLRSKKMQLSKEIEEQYEEVKNTVDRVNHAAPKLLKQAQEYLAKLKSNNTVGSERKTASDSQTKLPSSIQLGGLVPLHPQLNVFFQNMHNYSNQQLQQDQQAQQHIFARYNQLENAILSLSRQSENRLSERDLDKIFQDYSDATQKVQEVYQQNSQKAKFHEQQYELEKRLRWLHEQQMIVKHQFDMLKPRIETQESLVQSLNRVLIMLHQFSNEQGLQWLEFIKQERSLCLNWKLTRNNYQNRILSFRSETRAMISDQIENAKQELAEVLHQCFRDLADGHYNHLNEIGAIVKEYQVHVGQHRELIDLNHEKILKFKLEDVSHEIINLTDAMDFIMEQKETLSWHEYKVKMQEMLIMFVETIKSMLEALFDDSTVVDYLKYLDEYCVTENNKGVLTVPCPRSSATLIQLPSSTQTWIQLTEFPQQVDAMSMMSGSNTAREEAEEFVLEKRGYQQEHDPIPEEQENLGELIRNLNSFLYK